MPLELWLVSLTGLALAWEKDRDGFFLFRGGFREWLVECLELLAALGMTAALSHYGHAWLPPWGGFQDPAEPLALTLGGVLLLSRAASPSRLAAFGLLAIHALAAGPSIDFKASLLATGRLLASILIFEGLLLGLWDRLRLAAVPKLMQGGALRLLIAALLSLVLWGVPFLAQS